MKAYQCAKVTVALVRDFEQKLAATFVAEINIDRERDVALALRAAKLCS
jgi:hypothetical protein